MKKNPRARNNSTRSGSPATNSGAKHNPNRMMQALAITIAGAVPPRSPQRAEIGMPSAKNTMPAICSSRNDSLS